MAGPVKPWWPLQWENPPKGSNYCNVTLANGKQFRVYDDEDRVSRLHKRLGNTGKPVVRYEIRRYTNEFGRMSPKYIRADTLLEVRACLVNEELADGLLSE